MPSEEPEKGDKVSWNWGGGQPGGKVVETKTEGEIAIKSKRGNTIKKNASPSNPAVHVGRSGNDVVKRANELMVDEKAENGNASGSGEKKRDIDEVEKDDEAGEEGEEKAAAEEQKDEKKDENKDEKKDEKDEREKEEVKKPEAKKQKKEPAASKKKKTEKAEKDEKKPAPAAEKKQVNGDGGEAKKGRGRPKGTGAPAGGAAGEKKKKKAAKPRATEGIGSRTRSRA